VRLLHSRLRDLCRCGTYPHVFEAALAAGRALRAKGGK
jgi:aerobic-type carbon monoxide dehydrogenase small subunit (CoxS/CutS family)